MKKLNLLILFGGRSLEHDVSIITAFQTIQHADQEKYTLLPVYWTQEGLFLTAVNWRDPKRLLKDILREKRRVSFDIGRKSLVIHGGLLRRMRTIPVDVVFPIFHGTYGEDGSIQGLLEVLNVPFVGPSITAAAIGMDKFLFKNLMQRYDIPVLDGQILTPEEAKELKELKEPKFPYPVIVKPVHLGSSIGVKKATNLQEIHEALEVIFRLDTKALIEPYLDDVMEVNCAVLGSSTSQDVSVCEQPIPVKEILSFEDKYLRGGKKVKAGGMASLERRIPAPISKEETQYIQTLAKQIFLLCECSGVARIDFLLDRKTRKIYVNEINTIPGSLAFYLWEASGVSFRELIDHLVEIAFEEQKKKNAIQRVYPSPLLEQFLED